MRQTRDRQGDSAIDRGTESVTDRGTDSGRESERRCQTKRPKDRQIWIDCGTDKKTVRQTEAQTRGQLMAT